MARNPDLKDILLRAAEFSLFRLIVGAVVLILYLTGTALAIVFAGDYRVEVVIFCAGILPLFVFLPLHIVLSRMSWKRLNHGLHYRSHSLFLLIPLACVSTVALTSVMKREGRLDWYYNWQARGSYIGWLPGTVDCAHTSVGESIHGPTSLFELTGDTEATLDHLRARFIELGFEETDDSPYIRSRDLPEWWRGRRENDGAASLRFAHPDNRVIGVWHFPDSNSVYVEVAREL